jgi:hypothetical protein
MTGRHRPPLGAALAYLGTAGRSCRSSRARKRPVTRHGCSEASTDPRQIADWWSRNPARNVAIVAGAPGPDVLYIDVHQDGTGYPALCQCRVSQLKREGLVPDPLVVVSTPSGGLHLYFRW